MIKLKNKTLNRILKYLLKYKYYIIAAIVSSLICNILIIIAPLYTGRAIDYIISDSNVDFSAVLKIIILLAIFYFISSFFQWMLSIITNIIANATVRSIRQEAFDKINLLPLKFYDNNPHGDIISRLINDIDAISEGLILGITQLFSGIVIIAGSFFFMFKLSTIITFVVIIITPLSFLIASFVAKMSNKMFKEQSKILGELNGYIEEIIGNQKVVKAFSYEDASQEKFNEINQRLYGFGQKAQFYSSLTNPLARFINHISYISAGIIGGILAIGKRLSIGNISSFLIYSTQFSKPINEITSIATQFQSALASAERIFAILDEEEEILESNNKTLKECRGHVIFKNIYFSYEKTKPFIQNFNADIAPGKLIAIVGPTGSGKTTLVNLLMRFYEVNSGEIYIDNINIKDITKDNLRRSFGMVLQESWLFSGTIKDNIAYGKPDATLSEIEAAARESYAHDFIRMLPNGYDTIITEDGGNLSQGQKQLLTIARVMLTNPSMLILDEATSSIDTLTEARIQKAFRILMEGRTSFVIAHRLSTIREADLILVLKDGQIIEQGDHGELLSKKGFYYKLYHSQHQ